MKRLHRFAAICGVASLTGFVAIESASTAPVDLVAKAGNQELSVERLASLMATSAIPIQRDVAAAVADFWVSYQLVALAGSQGDTLTNASTTNWWLKDTPLIDSVMWHPFLDARVKLFFEKVTREIAMPDTSNLEEKYATSQMLAAQHILIMMPEDGAGMSQAKRDSARKLAEDLRRRVTPQNFSALAKEFSEDQGSKANGGSYAMFGPGTGLDMVPEFDQAVRRAKPGEIAPGLVRTTYGFHIIRRHTLAEVRSAFIDQLAQANIGTKGQQYVEKLLEDWKLTLAPGAAANARRVAVNPVAVRNDSTVLATSLVGRFTASRLGEWIDVIPSDVKIRETMTQAPDSIVERALRRIVSQEIMQAQAIKDGVQIEPADAEQIRTTFASMVTFTMTGLKVDPKSLRDSARTIATRERLAASRVEAALDRLFATNGQDLVEVGPQLAAALRKRYPSRISSASLDLAVQRGIAVRAALDSTRARTGPKRG